MWLGREIGMLGKKMNYMVQWTIRKQDGREWKEEAEGISSMDQHCSGWVDLPWLSHLTGELCLLFLVPQGRMTPW